jgi:hypothetical protein
LPPELAVVVRCDTGRLKLVVLLIRGVLAVVPAYLLGLLALRCLARFIDFLVVVRIDGVKAPMARKIDRVLSV